MEVTNFTQVTSWARALDAARITVGKVPLTKEPSDEWKAQMILAEHSPIRLVEYQWIWVDIPQYVTTHLVRHHIGCEKFVCTQREDRTGVLRNQRLQTDLNSFMMTANAQAIINISRKRLCQKADSNTKYAWALVIIELAKIDPILANKCVPECYYRGFCPELKSCGAASMEHFPKRLKNYRTTK